jgi:hypothetical protein
VSILYPLLNMSDSSRAEINLKRLLVRCEAYENVDWRFEKYIDSLCDYLIKSVSSTPTEVLFDYTRRIILLRGKLSSPNPSDRDLLLRSSRRATALNSTEQQHDTNKRLAQEILQSVRDISENARISGRVIREDIKKLSSASTRVDGSCDDIQAQTARLNRRVTGGRSIVVLVVVIFAWMVFIIKVFPV